MAKTHKPRITTKASEYISLTAHQLKTPLSIIRWLLQSLSNSNSNLSAEQINTINDITKENDRMIQLIDLLLNINRIESGRIDLNPIPIEINQFINKLIQDQIRIATLKKIGVSFIPTDKMTFSYFDPILVHNALSNILNNAIKYTPSGGKIKLIITCKNNGLILEIKDTGYGIPKEEQPKIFTRFYRAANVLERDTEGAGLGLYLTKLIIKASKGKVWFESEEKKGTTFFVQLPKLEHPELER